MKIPKKIKRHLLKMVGLFAAYYEIMDRFEAANLLMSVVTPSEPFIRMEYIVTGIFLVILIWLCWRLYTGVYRDGDFWME